MLFINLEKACVQKEIRQRCQGKSGVYQITNLQNKKKYIASFSLKIPTGNRLYYRFPYHFVHASKDYPVKRAIQKYGISSFSWEILEWTPVEETTNRESWYIKKLLPEYNILQIAASSLGYKHTALTRKNMKQSYSMERRRTIGALYKGKTRTLESREKMSASARARTALHLKIRNMLARFGIEKLFQNLQRFCGEMTLIF